MDFPSPQTNRVYFLNTSLCNWKRWKSFDQSRWLRGILARHAFIWEIRENKPNIENNEVRAITQTSFDNIPTTTSIPSRSNKPNHLLPISTITCLRFQEDDVSLAMDVDRTVRMQVTSSIGCCYFFLHTLYFFLHYLVLLLERWQAKCAYDTRTDMFHKKHRNCLDFVRRANNPRTHYLLTLHVNIV